jgi:hypothetical protein
MGKMSANILNILEDNLETETGTLYTLNQQEIKTLITQLRENTQLREFDSPPLN